MLDQKMIFIPCDCYDTCHFLRFMPDPDIEDAFDCDFISTRNGSFWQRVKWALKHVFGNEDLVFADLIIRRSELERVLTELGGEDA